MRNISIYRPRIPVADYALYVHRGGPTLEDFITATSIISPHKSHFAGFEITPLTDGTGHFVNSFPPAHIEALEPLAIVEVLDRRFSRQAVRQYGGWRALVATLDPKKLMRYAWKSAWELQILSPD
jgi:hypothetical protein